MYETNLPYRKSTSKNTYLIQKQHSKSMILLRKINIQEVKSQKIACGAQHKGKYVEKY